MLIGFQTDIHKSNYENIEKRISELIGEINFFDGPSSSGNIAIDAIVNYKSSIASKKNISVFANMIIPENLQVDSVSICQILGNALDNAIEATEMLDDSRDRIIQVYIGYDQEVLFFKISNPFCGRIVINTIRKNRFDKTAAQC